MISFYMGLAKRIWYLSPMRAAKVQASLRIRAVSSEPPLLAHTGSESRGTFRQKAKSLAPLNGWACVVKICHDGMLEDTNSLDGAHIKHEETKIKQSNNFESHSLVRDCRLICIKTIQIGYDRSWLVSTVLLGADPTNSEQ